MIRILCLLIKMILLKYCSSGVDGQGPLARNQVFFAHREAALGCFLKANG